MREMRAVRAPITKPADVVLGPCPGCDNWQIDYTDEVAQQFVVLRYPAEGAGRDEHWLANVEIDTTPWHAVIEDALQEHMLECPHLRDLVEAYG